MLNTIVTSPSSAMRSEARSYLSGNWKNAVLTTIVFVLITSAPSFILKEFLSRDTTSIFSIVYSLFVGAPITLGYTMFILKLTRKQNAEMSDLFEGFNNYGTIVFLAFKIGLFVVLWSLLLVIPGIIAALRYSQAYYVFIDNPKMGASEALDKSKELMRGNAGKLFLFILSFIGWFLLLAITCGIAGLWVLPYFYAAMAVFYRKLTSGEISNNEISSN